MESARLIIEVVAGVVPEHPEPEYTMRWVLTAEQWETEGVSTLQRFVDEALLYARGLMMRPDVVNWVRTDWIWP